MQLVFIYIYRQTHESLIPYFTADEYYLWCVSSPISLKPLLSMAMAFMSLIPTQTRSNSLSFPSPPIFFSSQSPSHRLLPRSINPSSPPPSISIRASISPNPPRAATTAFDLQKDVALERSAPSLPFRIGHGFDLHRLEPGYPLIIGGISIPHDRGCEAHSDGDVLLHCVVDAILGALGLPDIGQIFPDTDPKWKGAASSVFMKEAVRLMHEAGYELGNLDATLILQRPKLSPHKESIRANLCELLGADPSVVNLKAKTHEKVDSLGENRSIAAHTVVLLMRK